MSRFNPALLASRLTLIITILMLGCTKDNPAPTSIHPDFVQYVNRFVAEARLRNVVVNVDKLAMQYITDPGTGICGQSIPGATPYVQIVQTCWLGLSDTYRENLVFHELGHAILGRPHLDTEFPNGLWVSMMHSSSIYMYTKYQPELRAYHLYELFHEGIQVPDVLIAPKLTSSIIFNDTVSVSSNWVFRQSATSKQVGIIDRNNYSTSHSSLSIKGSGTGSSTYWYKYFTPAQIPVGSGLVLKVKIKLDQVTTGSAWIAIEVITKSGDIALLKSTKGLYNITGTQDFVEYTFSSPYSPQNADFIYILLGMNDNSTGTVYFDDVSLTKKI